MFTVTFHVNLFFTNQVVLQFGRKICSKIQGFNAQSKIHIEKAASSLLSIALAILLDYERRALSNAVGFFTKL